MDANCVRVSGVELPLQVARSQSVANLPEKILVHKRGNGLISSAGARSGWVKNEGMSIFLPCFHGISVPVSPKHRISTDFDLFSVCAYNAPVGTHVVVPRKEGEYH